MASKSTSNADQDIQARLRDALRAKGPHYVPRTRHKNVDGSPKYINRLIFESSPYLLQHAHNPVNWYAWGPQAFERAQALHRPIFLSIGYSTCHWCHVMEVESFEDEDIARYLNEHYVAIKVDREEHPDIDAAYMSFVQAFTGSGGWPMSVWLTPARDPFFGGTYFPAHSGDRGARVGFIDLLREQYERFAAAPEVVAHQAQQLAVRLQTAQAPEPQGDFPSASVLLAASAEAQQRFDPVMGGTRGAPKFPSSFPIRLLLRTARRSNDTHARNMAQETLDHMRQGGIYDPIGGGFHRYSTDARWLVPHFEKMLYDNADLTVAYLEAASTTSDHRYLNTVREILDYLLREMRAPNGTFYSATDADSATASGHHAEGVYFTWTPAELNAALGDADARVAQAWFGVTQSGQLEGRSVLHTQRSLSQVASELALTPAQLEKQLTSIRQRLLARRATRPAPQRDDKVIVAWNALVITALARSAMVLADSHYAEAAIQAAQVLMAPFNHNRELPHSFFGAKGYGRGYSDDYVFLAAAQLDVFELTSDSSWLEQAAALMNEVERTFTDFDRGGYYLTSASHERLFMREKPDYDGPTPSVNSVAALTWLRLYALTDDDRYRKRAESTMRAFSRKLNAQPLGLDRMLLALDWATDAVKEIAIIVSEGQGALTPAARPLLDVLANHFVPNSVLVVTTESDTRGKLGSLVPWIRDKKLLGGQATAYVCERGACKLPTHSPDVFAQQLAAARPYP